MRKLICAVVVLVSAASAAWAQNVVDVSQSPVGSINGQSVSPATVTIAAGTGSACLSVDSPSLVVDCNLHKVTAGGAAGLVVTYGMSAGSATIPTFLGATSFTGATHAITYGITAATATIPTMQGPMSFTGATHAVTYGITAATATIGGYTDGSAAAAGKVGEFISSATINNFGASGAFGDVAAVSLTAGDWDCDLNASFAPNGSTVSSEITLGIGTATGNNGAGLTAGDNQVWLPPCTAAIASGGAVSGYRISISATTTYYAKVSATWSVSVPRAYTRFSCRRRR